jgi:hypothetical protein
MDKEEQLQKTRSMLEDSSDDLEHFVYKTKQIEFYNIKSDPRFCFEHVNPKRYRKKIYKCHNLQILGICDDKSRFVVNPKKTLQITKYGGTVKILRLEKGYALESHCKEETKGISGEVGIEAAGTGVKVAIDNSYLSQFKMEMGKLTHEHLVMITDTDEPLCHGSCLRPYRDVIDINLDYLKIEKKLEEFIWNEMGNTYNRIYNN